MHSSSKLRRAIARLSPEGQTEFTETPLMGQHLDAVLQALQALPAGADAGKVRAALAPFAATGWEAEVARVAMAERQGTLRAHGPCWFCGRRRGERPCTIIQGAHARICGDCVESVATVLAAPSSADDQAVEPERCAFCTKWGIVNGRPSDRGVRIVRGLHTTVCHECIAMMLEILHEVAEQDADGTPRSPA